MSEQNLALIFSKVPETFPVPGEHLQVKDIKFDSSKPLPENSLDIEVLYLSLDPYMRGRLRDSSIKSYFPAFELNQPLQNFGVATVKRSSVSSFKENDTITGFFPFQQRAIVTLDSPDSRNYPKHTDPENGPKDLRHYTGALGLAGITAYSSLYEIGKPKKGETIFISSAAGAVGQIVGQLAKHEGLKVIGSVGSDDKVRHLLDELSFDGAFNYKTEKPTDALKRLAPQGIDIYYENVGGEQLEAAIDNMNMFGRIVACGMISQYNLTADQRYGIKNLMMVVGKRLTMTGFIASDLAPKYAEEHRKNVGAWLKDGTFKATLHETVGMEKGAEALVGMLKGENFGKAVLKVKQ